MLLCQVCNLIHVPLPSYFFSNSVGIHFHQSEIQQTDGNPETHADPERNMEENGSAVSYPMRSVSISTIFTSVVLQKDLNQQNKLQFPNLRSSANLSSSRFRLWTHPSFRYTPLTPDPPQTSTAGQWHTLGNFNSYFHQHTSHLQYRVV